MPFFGPKRASWVVSATQTKHPSVTTCDSESHRMRHIAHCVERTPCAVRLTRRVETVGAHKPTPTTSVRQGATVFAAAGAGRGMAPDRPTCCMRTLIGCRISTDAFESLSRRHSETYGSVEQQCSSTSA